MTSPDIYKKKLNELSDRFYLVAEGLERNFIAHKVYPNHDENNNLYERDKNNMESLTQQFFLLKNNIEKESTKLQQKVSLQDSEIDRLRKLNKGLQKTENSLDGSDLGSREMINDFQVGYNTSLIELTSKCIGVILIFFIFYLQQNK